jgi:hypothetical protein
MNDKPDLGSALTQIAAGAARAHNVLQVAGADLPLAAMHTAARRRRTRFEAGVGLVAATVVGALVLGGAAAGIGDRDAAPPAGTESWDVDYAACGTTVGDPSAAPSAGSRPVTLTASTGPLVDSNALVTVATTARAAGQGILQRVGTQHTAVALDSAGTVVGVLGVPAGDPPDDLVPADAGSLTLTTTAPLFSCLDQDGTTRLGAGGYALTVSRSVEMLVDGAAAQQPVAEQWSFTIPPAPTGTDPGALPTTTVAGTGPGCGQVLDVGAGDPGPLTISMDQPPAVTEGGSLMDVFAVFTMTNADDDTLEVAGGGVRLVLTLGDTVVGFSSRGTPAVPFEPETARAADDSVSYLLDCPAGLMPGGPQSGEYLLWVVVGLAGEPATSLVAGPWALDAWTAVDPSILPADVPILDERILRAEVSGDGSSWRVTLQLNDAGADGYPLAVAALKGAGFTVDLEATDPARPAWDYAELSTDAFRVTLDISNETGEGFYADYWITRL